LPIVLSKKFCKKLDHYLAACQLRPSGVRGAGNGVFLNHAASEKQILLHYKGARISFAEADRLRDQVL
jgi:hypothetical protein